MYDVLTDSIQFGAFPLQGPDTALRHLGSHTRLVRQHVAEVRSAVDAEHWGRIQALLKRRITDAHTMRYAADRLLAHGHKASGPNTLCLEFLTSSELWSLCRVLAQAARNDTYRPGPERVLKIPKPSGGSRPLVLQNVEDRVVGRAVTLILQPLADRRFSPFSFGSRPECSPHVALATAVKVSQMEGRWTWVSADVAHAFDAVPHNRFLDACRKHFPDDVVDLIHTVSATGKSRGIRQGSPASPLFFNIFGDHFLDRQFAKKMPGVRLLRYVDDVLLLCRDQSEAAAALECLQEVARVAGTPLKPATTVANILVSENIDWLGFRVQRQANELTMRLTERAWDQLSRSLIFTQEQPLASIRALHAIRGWLNYLAPCFECEDRTAVYARMRQLAHECSFDELPDDQWLHECWQPAYAHWMRARKTLIAQTPIRLDLQARWLRGEILPLTIPDVGGDIDSDLHR